MQILIRQNFNKGLESNDNFSVTVKDLLFQMKEFGKYLFV